MIGAFSTAVGTAVTAMVSDVTDAVGANSGKVIAVSLGLVGLFVVWYVLRSILTVSTKNWS